MAVKTLKKRPRTRGLHLMSNMQPPPVSPEVKKVFDQCFKQWKADERPTSIMLTRVAHPAYLRIISLGPPALPLILRALEKEPDPWFWALTAITGEDLTPKSHSFRFSKLVEAWLQWGRKRGYLT